jgi:hypothetical protein
MAAKTGPAYAMSSAHRDKIKNSNILNALIEHAEGTREMSATQVTAGIGLLRKVLPDLAAVTVAGDEEHPLIIRATIGGNAPNNG